MAETYIPEHRNPIHTGTNIRFVKEQPYTALEPGHFRGKDPILARSYEHFRGKDLWGISRPPAFLNAFCCKRARGASPKSLKPFPRLKPGAPTDGTHSARPRPG